MMMVFNPNNFNTEIFSHFVRSFRTEHELTIEQFGIKASISLFNMHGIDLRVHYPSVHDFVNICVLTKISETEFFQIVTKSEESKEIYLKYRELLK